MRRTFDSSRSLCIHVIRLYFSASIIGPIHQTFYPQKLLAAFILFVSLRLNREPSKQKKKEGKLVCVRSLLARDHKQGMQSILAYNCTNTDTRHLCVVTCSRMQTRTQLQYKNARQALLPVHYLVGTYSPTLIHLFRRSEKRFFLVLASHLYMNFFLFFDFWRSTHIHNRVCLCVSIKMAVYFRFSLFLR